MRGLVQTNGIQGFWSQLKRTYQGTHHCMSPKHLYRYVNQAAWTHNSRALDALEKIREMAGSMHGRRRAYEALTARELACLIPYQALTRLRIQPLRYRTYVTH